MLPRQKQRIGLARAFLRGSEWILLDEPTSNVTASTRVYHFYDAFGHVIGSEECEECEEGKIFIEPQGMCVMAGIGVDPGEAVTALQSVKDKLDTKYGIVLLQPAYTKYHLELGKISSYPPGYKENAGIFCHNNPWVSCAETVVGHGDRAFEIYKKTCPAYIEDISEIHRTEPYVYSQMVAGRDAATFGEAKNSWLTVRLLPQSSSRSGLLLFLYGLYTPACCFTNQKTPLPCCVRSRIREYFLCAACQVWLYREHFSASIASTTISAQRASLGSATSMVYVSVQFQSSLAICATVCLLGARMS